MMHYCQKCLAANPLGQELCTRCGTRLMLVVEPPAARFEDGGLVASHEEHLLERISALENRFLRLTDKLEQTLNLMLKQARSIYFDHTLLDSLIEVLNEAGAFDAVKLNKLWRERYRNESVESEETLRHEVVRTKIVAAYKGAEKSTFELIINEGIDHLNKNETDQGIKKLERGAAFDPRNAPLNAFLGTHFFETWKPALARDYLERALSAEPKSEGARLLLSLICIEMGEPERGKKLLKGFLKKAGESFAARCGLGILLATESRWAEALREFKRALAALPSPESHYAAGCASYMLGRYSEAAEYFSKAIEQDVNYVAARYALGLTYLRLGRREEARDALQAVNDSGVDEKNCAAEAHRVLRTGRLPANPRFWGLGRDAKKSRFAGGDRRLSEAVRQDALNTVRLLSFPD